MDKFKRFQIKSAAEVLKKQLSNNFIFKLLLFALFCFLFHPSISQNKALQFEKVTIDAGLSQSTVNAIIEDKEGFIWFGTGGGINRYDGEKFKVYKNSLTDKNSISGNYVSCMHEDKEGILWIGTVGGGINKFDRIREKFETLNPPSSDDGIDRIFSIYEDSSEMLYFGSEGAGIVTVNKKTNEIKILKSSQKEGSVLDRNTIYDFILIKGRLYGATAAGIQEVTDNGLNVFIPKINDQVVKMRTLFSDQRDEVWVGSEKGLGRLQLNGSPSIEFPLRQLENIPVLDIEEDSKQNLWIATLGQGLALVNKERTKVTFYKKDFNDRNSLNNNDLNTIFKDETGIIWIGTLGGGVNKYDESVSKFQSHQSPYSDNLTGIIEDEIGHVWYTNSSMGVTRYNPTTGDVKNFPQNGLIQRFLTADKNGNIWGTTPFAALNKFSKEKGKFESVLSLKSGYVLITGSDGLLYLPTFEQGLKIIDPKTEEVETTPYSPNLTNINCIVEGKENIWLGSLKGMVGVYNKKTRKITEFQLTHQGKKITRSIRTIVEDSKGDLWLGTSTLGIFRLDPTTFNCLSVFNEKSGLPSDEIAAMLEDKNGTIWISTNNGLASLNPDTKSIKTYNKADGIVHKEFNNNVAWKGKNGALYFGGLGFNYFTPENIRENRRTSPVVIVDFQVFNQTVPVKETANDSAFSIPKAIHHTKEINLSYKQNVISFEFATLNYSLPQKNKYMYKMEGFDREWINSGTKRTAVYTNLDPGVYTFKVKGANNDGVWSSEAASIKIYVAPPFWNTWWAYMIYSLIFAGIVYSIWRYFTNREKLKNELKLKSLESQQLQQMDQVKTRFYTNVSHEFRTPLTLILGPLEAAIQTSDKEEADKKLTIVHRNAKRLLDLINQLLDVSKLESGNIRLVLEDGDIIKFLRTCTASFSSMAVSKQVELRFISTIEFLNTQFDKDKVEKMINNLLSNALKFTSEGGSVEVFVSEENSNLILEVSDTGIGIPEDKYSLIFNRYYQVENKSKAFEGTGIGLALLKELVAIHNGKIDVTSKEGEGTTFSVSIPLKIADIKKTDKKEETFGEYVTALLESKTSQQDLSDIPLNLDKPIVLVVEDNAEVREFVTNILIDRYIVLNAENGEKGLSLAERHIPDLIVSDVMMPGLDGIEFTKVVKTNEKTSHIPVILLTAKASREHKLEGLETGADDYLTKPFDMDELLLRVKNLIQQREKLRKRFAREVTLQPKDIAITSSDEIFLNRCIAVIEANISNSDFSVDEFGKEVGMSRSQLHRKLKALTDQSTGEFIRNIKLKRAADLIRKNFGNTSEVAYEVGFNNVSYFIKCFKEFYGKTPSEF